MRLSIIVPVYNVKPYLARCIDSLLDQGSFKDYEIILVDDGSTDGSGDICDAYAEKQDNIVVIHKENGGASNSRNIGLKTARGNYIMFVDSDDYIRSNCLNSLVDKAQTETLDILCFNFRYVFDQYKTQHNDQILSDSLCIITGEEYLINNLSAGTMLMVVWKSIYRRSLLSDNKFFFREGYVHEDEDWVPRVFARAKRVAQVNHDIYAYFIRNDSVSRNDKQRKASLDLIEHCKQLKLFCGTLSNPLLKTRLENNIATLALSAFFKGKLTSERENILSLCNGLFLERKNKKKIKLLKTSASLYLLINTLNKTLINLCKKANRAKQRSKIIADAIINRIQTKARHLFVSKSQCKQMKNHTFSLLASTCNGGVITSELGEQFRSPTINLWFEAKDFVRFVGNLSYYLSLEITEVTNNFEPYPVGRIGDITIYFMHYHSFAEAKRKWDERKARMNFDNLFIMMAQRNGCDDETVAAFDALPYKNKIIFTAKEYPDFPSAIYTPKYSENGEVGILTDFVGLTKRKYDEYLDCVSWLNGNGH